jgi:oxygen-independent coproporphyrinogen-3 oxidase
LDSVAVYVHIPFCPSKCGYCDFNSYAQTGEIQTRTARAIAQEIRQSPFSGVPAKTIFFGGGTPTFLAITDLMHVFDAVLEVHPPLPNAEITSEANPGTVDAEKFATMRTAGFNRISLGAQSFLDSDLVRLDRIHRGGDIERAVTSARRAGFENINLDLMFALPQQSRRAWHANLDRALALEPEHLSLYCLTIEPNTAFYKKFLRGEITQPDDDAQVEMYEDCFARAAQAGFENYEISNFAKPGFECKHNLEYWHGRPYAGYGPGAVGCLPFPDGPTRYTNLKLPERYCHAVESGADIPYEKEVLSDSVRRTELIMLGLRLREGIPEAWPEPHGVKVCLNKGWIRVDDGCIRLTAAGRHLCSEVALALIP